MAALQMSLQRLSPILSKPRLLFIAAALVIAALLAAAIFAGAVQADDGGDGSGHGGDDGGNSGHGSDNSGSGSSGSGGDDGESEDNSGPGPNSGPGSSGDDDDDGESEEGEDHEAAGAGSDRGNDPYVRGEIVVADVDATELGVIRGYGFRVLEETRLEALGLTILRLALPSGWAEDRARAQIAAALPGVIVDVNSLYAMQGQTTLPPPGYGQQMIGWRYAAPGCGRGMKIGMLDTAIEQSLPEFSGARVTQQSLAPNAAPAPHGTAIAAILVGQPEASLVPGLVPEAELSIAAVFAADADGRLSADAIALVGGLDWLARRKVEIVNMSLAGEPNALVEIAIGRLRERGMLFVAAVGNGGAASAPGFPASLSDVIGVTAIDSSGALYKNAPRGGEIDFSAPGVRIWGPSGGSAAGRYFSGTSFAAPFVTAAVALAMQDGPRDGASLVQLLGRAARDLGDAGKDPAFGWGLIAAPSACGPRNRAS
jgi:hypothetical protein